ncbi:MAG: hypothetical protein K0S80_1508, partial [Neobacillus sp.]|nr:hypothetical protein [Neobacillus sp.]
MFIVFLLVKLGENPWYISDGSDLGVCY